MFTIFSGGGGTVNENYIDETAPRIIGTAYYLDDAYSLAQRESRNCMAWIAMPSVGGTTLYLYVDGIEVQKYFSGHTVDYLASHCEIFEEKFSKV